MFISLAGYMHFDEGSVSHKLTGVKSGINRFILRFVGRGINNFLLGAMAIQQYIKTSGLFS
jgi:hypothetical protein